MLTVASLLFVFIFLVVLGFILGVIKIHLDIYINGLTAQIKADVRLWRIKWLSVDIPELKFDPEAIGLSVKNDSRAVGKNIGQKNSIDQEELFKGFENFRDWLHFINDSEAQEIKFLKSIKIQKVKWYTAMGLKEAHWTGQATGLLWSIKGLAVSGLSRVMTLTDTPYFDIKPIFDRKVWRTHFTCMISFKLTKAISAVFCIVRLNKGRDQTTCQNIQSKA